MLRSIVSVIVGYLVMVATVMMTTVIAFVVYLKEFLKASKIGTNPPAAALRLQVALGLPCGVLGGATCAEIVRRACLPHAAILADVTFLLGISMAVFGRQPFHPVWYVFTLPITGAVCILLGGSLGERLRH